MQWQPLNTRPARLGAALALSLACGNALADSVEVMHWWTSGGEGAAVSVLKQNLEAKGVTWQDMAVAGGGGEAASTALRARVVAGDPPTAAQQLGMAVRDWAKQGALANLDEVAGKEGWDKVVPPAIQAFGKYQGHWVAAPVNIHRPTWLWMNAKVFKDNGLQPPHTWDEFNATAEKLKAKGIVAVAMGGQPWQEATVWEDVVLGIGGPDFYRRAVIDADPKAIDSPTMVKVFDEMRKIRGYVDRNFAGRDWNLATAMVLRGEAGMQLMGDWAKGEVVAAKLTPGREILCTEAPGTAGSFLFNTDFFAMFNVSREKRPAQLTMASAIMEPGFQETFNLAKGSIPARSDTPTGKFDECAKKSMADLATATKANHVYGSLAHGHGLPAALQGVYFDAITKHFNSEESSKAAAEDLAHSVIAAKQ